MDEPRKKPGWAFWTTVIAAGVLVLYVGAYLSSVQPVVCGTIRYVTREDDLTMDFYGLPGTSPVNSDSLRWIFTPLNALDRRIRAEQWQPVRYPGGK